MQLRCETCITICNLLKFICSFLLIGGGGTVCKRGRGFRGGLRNTPANTWPFNLCEQRSKSKTFFMPRFKFMTSHRAHSYTAGSSLLQSTAHPSLETTPDGQNPVLLLPAQRLIWRFQFHIGFGLQRVSNLSDKYLAHPEFSDKREEHTEKIPLRVPYTAFVCSFRLEFSTSLRLKVYT